MSDIQVTPQMARVFIAALAEAKQDSIPKIYAAGQREERDVIVALRAAIAYAEATP